MSSDKGRLTEVVMVSRILLFPRSGFCSAGGGIALVYSATRHEDLPQIGGMQEGWCSGPSSSSGHFRRALAGILKIPLSRFLESEMKVLVLGGGTVGSSVARFLCHKGHEVTVVDQKYEVCAQLGESTDVRTIVGPGSVASTLFRAEVGSHDLCLALTNNHEVNLVASCLAKTMGAGRTVARVYADILLDLHRLDYRKAFGVDRFLGIEYLTALEIVRRIRDPVP